MQSASRLSKPPKSQPPHRSATPTHPLPKDLQRQPSLASNLVSYPTSTYRQTRFFFCATYPRTMEKTLSQPSSRAFLAFRSCVQCPAEAVLHSWSMRAKKVRLRRKRLWVVLSWEGRTSGLRTKGSRLLNIGPSCPRTARCRSQSGIGMLPISYDSTIDAFMESAIRLSCPPYHFGRHVAHSRCQVYLQAVEISECPMSFNTVTRQ